MPYYKCRYCSSTFTTPWNAKRHEKIHLGIKRFHCLQCDKRFRERHHLQIHELIHGDIKPFRCPYCRQTMRDRSNMQRHMTTVHGVDADSTDSEYDEEEKVADSRTAVARRNPPRSTRRSTPYVKYHNHPSGREPKNRPVNATTDLSGSIPSSETLPGGIDVSGLVALTMAALDDKSVVV